MTKSNPFADRIAQAAKEGYVNGKREFTNTRIPNAVSDDGFPVTRYVARTVKATKKQIALITSLLAERDLAAETRPKFVARLDQLTKLPSEIDNLDIAQASKLIEYLFGMPTKPVAPETDEFASVPAGSYAVTVNGELWFVQVDRPTEGKWAGRVFVKRQNGSDMTRLYPNVQRKVLNNIAVQGPATCSAEYGHKLGHCGVCGRELTNEESRAYGIGPVCREKNGW